MNDSEELQQAYVAVCETTAFKAGVVVERERVRELLRKWCNQALVHEDFMQEFDGTPKEVSC